MATELLMMKKGKHLVSAEAFTEELLDSMKQDEIVSVKISRKRNGGHHRKYMVLLGEVFRNQTRYANMTSMRKAIEMGAGHFETIMGLDGKDIRLPASVAYHKLDQHEFEQVYDAVITLICTKILPVSPDDLKRRVEELL